MDGRFMELALTPSGRITVRQTTDSAGSPPASLQGAETDGPLGRVAKAFGISQGEGLFLLATERFDGPLPPTFSYWREFAVGYLTALCHTPEIAGLELEAIAPPTPAELATLILSVPPMQGAEYLNEAVLVGVWEDLDAWVRGDDCRRRRRVVGLLEAAGAAVAPGGAGLLPPGREPPQRGLSLCLSGDLCAERGVRLPRPVSAAQQGPPRIGRRQEQAGLGAAALAGASGVAAERPGQGAGRLGRPLPAAGLDAARGLSLPQGRAGRSKRAAFWCGCPTGGRNARGPASA